MVRQMYPKTTDSHIRMTDNNGAGGIIKISYCYPRLEDILRPLRLISFDDVRVIMLFNKPIPSEYASGIPADIDDRRIFNKTTNINIVDDSNPIPCFVKIINDRLIRQEGDNVIPITNNMFSIYTWINQGVLPIFLSPTTENRHIDELDHTEIWRNYTKELLNSFIIANYSKYPNKPIIILPMSVSCDAFIEDLVSGLDPSIRHHVQNITLGKSTLPVIQNVINVEQLLSTANHYLGAMNEEPIDWYIGYV